MATTDDENTALRRLPFELLILDRKRFPYCVAGIVVSQRFSLFAVLALAASVFPAFGEVASAMDRVIIKRDGIRRVLDGRVLVEAQDGGMLVETQDTTYWVCEPSEIESKKTDERPFTRLNAEQTAEQVLSTLPDGFRVHKTKHYVICYNTTEVYASWCGALYERLFDAFHQYWNRQGLQLTPPSHPLVAVIHDTADSFRLEARKELGEGASVVIGYYSMQSNRINMYDLTGSDELGGARGRIRNRAHINQLLSQPAAERTVATIVHEATHQLAYNSGLQTRYAGNPFWVSEGMAVFFESPDLKSARGWRGIGAKHRVQLLEFRRRVANHDVATLRTMLSDDSDFRQSATAAAAYADAWAFNYYLLRRRGDEYADYLSKLAKLKPLEAWSAERRVAEFEESMGMELEKVEREFLAYMRRVR